MPEPVVLVGTLDTKGREFAFVRGLLETRGLDVIVVNFGVVGDPPFEPDIGADAVAQAEGTSLAELRQQGDKAHAMQTMAAGLTKVVRRLYEEGRLGGILGMGGSGGTSLATAAMRALPVGVPKVMVSTVAAGDVSAFVGTTDITMMPSIVDVQGLNSLSRRIYANAAGALAGMVTQDIPVPDDEKPVLAASMFGNTTQAVGHAQALLEADGYEVLVFHAVGTGGRTLEALVDGGYVAGVLDITTTELADEICGGVFSAGPDRLFAAAHTGVPSVIVPGCVDMANFSGIDTVPARYRDRTLYEWNPDVTLLRTNIEENQRIGAWIARAVNASTGPVAVLVPRKGVSQLDAPGGPFWDEAADRACFDTIKNNLKEGIPYLEMDHNINDDAFSEKAAALLLGMLKR